MSSEVLLPCLLREGDNVKKNRLFKLDRQQVTIGRSADVTYAIMSNIISRCHAILKKTDDQSWTITDNRSLNGVLVNGNRLTPSVPHTLHENDLVQFGVPNSSDVPADFVYRFHSKLKVRVDKKNKRPKEPDVDRNKDAKPPDEKVEENHNMCKKRKVDDEVEGQENTVFKRQETNAQSSNSAQRDEFQVKLAQLEQQLKEKELQQNEVEKQLEFERQQKEKQAKELQDLRMKEQAILMDMKLKQDELEKEKEELRQKMEKELVENIKAKETALMSQLQAEEKIKIEESIKKEMEKELEEKNKDVEQKLVNLKNLEKVIERKEMEQRMLESQLNETKVESETAKLQALKAQEDVMSNFVDVMEKELQCTICSELFIKATSLDCAHAYCKLCIEQWKKVRKECPICRKPITFSKPAIVLENYIERMVEEFSDELKEKRRQLLEDRKVQQAMFDAKQTASTTTTGSGGRPRTQGGRRNQGQRTIAATFQSITTTRRDAAALATPTTSGANNQATTQTASTSGSRGH